MVTTTPARKARPSMRTVRRSCTWRIRPNALSEITGKTQGMKLRINPPRNAAARMVSIVRSYPRSLPSGRWSFGRLVPRRDSAHCFLDMQFRVRVRVAEQNLAIRCDHERGTLGESFAILGAELGLIRGSHLGARIGRHRKLVTALQLGKLGHTVGIARRHANHGRIHLVELIGRFRKFMC